MTRKYTLSIVLVFFSVFSARGQEVTGRVTGVDSGGRVDLEGAAVIWEGTSEGVLTDGQGRFVIPLSKTGSTRLAASYLGYRSCTIDIAGYETFEVDFELEPEEIEGVVISRRRSGTTFPRLSTQKIETITGAGLLKMACCNLSESFENSATVTVGFTDAVSGAKQVQLLGLSGIYTQMMDENIPTMRGLAATYGWSYTPGPWLESIQISKGASSVVNGYESVSGQINLEFKKPDNPETLFVNLYGDESSRVEANMTSAIQLNDKLSTGIFLHGSTARKGHDADRDGFLDQPRTRFVNAYNRWMWIADSKGIESREGFRFLYDKREGGQTGAAAKTTAKAYTTDIINRGFSLFNKTGISVGVRPGQSLGIITSFTNYTQDSRFGERNYRGTQNTFYINTLFSSFISNTSHRYTAGASFNFDDIDAGYRDGLPYNDNRGYSLGRREAVGGIFGQYTYDWMERVTILAGFRADYNSRYGWLYTPRINVRYGLTENIILRASAGKGYRAANALTDNIGVLATSRQLNVENLQELDIERAWNYGANLSFYIPLRSSKNIILSFDYFHTDFQNQLVVDAERDSRYIWFYNLKGRSYADVWQADISAPVTRGLDLFAAFRYNYTRITYFYGNYRYKREKPLTSRYRGLVNLSYATRFRKWVFDATAQFNGPSRLPATENYSADQGNSPFFPVYYLQITRNTKRLDIYAGVENLLDYRQKNPIMGIDDPFGTDFDSSRIWGPLMGRKIYAGIRLRVGKF
ncbi:MAG: TonB-dependent receptor [Rikenellaceae bacterium]|nr:TonB-dependent receptor [Rikenellaceae bacterium]